MEKLKASIEQLKREKAEIESLLERVDGCAWHFRKRSQESLSVEAELIRRMEDGKEAA